MNGRAKTAGVASLIALWWLSRSWPGLLADFSEDDLMNMYWAWVRPLPALVMANLTPFTSLYRPIGSAYYMAMFDAFGLHPLPFRVVAYALMLLNIWLMYRVAWAISGSRETGVMCALIGSYHPRLFGMLVNGGTIYDILCMTFFCLALWFYIDARIRGPVTGWRLAGFCGLYTLALNSKEMAASLPVVVLAYELIFHRLKRRWWWDLRAVWITGLMTFAAFWFRHRPPASFYGVPSYDMHLSVRQFFLTTKPLLGQLFYLRDDSLNTTAAVAILAALGILAAALRNRTMLFAWALIVLTPLPVNFIEYRGFFVMYLPMLGWALYAAAGLKMLRVKFLVPQWAMAGAAAALLLVVQSQDMKLDLLHGDPNLARIRELREALPRLQAKLPKGARVLVLNQPFDADSNNATYIVRLTYRDPAIAVDRVRRAERYDLAIDLQDGHYVRSER